MEIKKPENFNDILELQKLLDKSIHSTRPRTLEDIKKSIIAECIEFDEETPQSHKTWKTKPYDKAKELEELTDIWFFIAQLINYCSDNSNLSILQKENLNRFFNDHTSSYTESISILDIIFYLKGRRTDYDYIKFLIIDLMILTNGYCYTKNDILNYYWKKWQKNMSRIGKEWN
jgi:DUTP diphosphatase superfamily